MTKFSSERPAVHSISKNNAKPQKSIRTSLGRRFSSSIEGTLSLRRKFSQVVPTVEIQVPERNFKQRALTLGFKDPNLEKLFSYSNHVSLLSTVRFGGYISITFHMILALLEVIFGYSRGAMEYMLFSRLVIVLVTLSFTRMTFLCSFLTYFSTHMLLFYLIRGTLLVFQFYIGVEYGLEVDIGTKDNNNVYFFYSGRWSLPTSLIYISIIFNASGMGFILSSITAWYHVLLMTCFGRFIYKERAGSRDPQIFFSPVMITLCMISAYLVEKQQRLEFVAQYNIAEDRKLRDSLLKSMLPTHISEDLKENRRNVAESYNEVSILFCYISDFNRLTANAPATEIVKLVNMIVCTFDKATDFKGVYKVEAISETYMCAAGVPTIDPDHCEKIADMALTMMSIIKKKKWKFQGESIKIQIGIHSGPVVAGVIGNKTYSYHLFGDTVNTSSRMCSTSKPDHIHVSQRSYELLSPTRCYELESRGEILVKGKGKMNTYWLVRKNKTSSQCISAELGSLYEYIREHNESKKSVFSDSLSLIKSSRSSVHQPSKDDKEFEVATHSYTLSFLPREEKGKKKKKLSSRKCASSQSSTNNILIRMYANFLEKVFLHDYNEKNIPQFRASFYSGMLVLILGIWNEVYNYADEPHLEIRISLKLFGVMTLLIVCLYSYYSKMFSRQMQFIGGIGSIIAVATINTNVFLIKEWHLLDVNLITITAISLFMRLRFTTTVFVNLFSTILYTAFLLIAGQQKIADIIGYVCMAFFCLLVGEASCYKREYSTRMRFLLTKTIEKETAKCEEILANMLPSVRHAEVLMRRATIVDELDHVTLLYSDMVGFTQLSAKLSPAVVCNLLNRIYSAFDSHVDLHGVYKMDIIGDAFIVIGGLPGFKSQEDHAFAVTNFAIDMLKEIQRIKKLENVNIDMRIGIHSGKVVGGVVGIQRPKYLIWGKHALIANVMESKGVPGQIQLSSTTYSKLHQKYDFNLPVHQNLEATENEFINTYLMKGDEVLRPKQRSL